MTRDLYDDERAWVDPEVHGTSALHEARIDAVLGALRSAGARTVLDLGCGAGALLLRLVRDPQFISIAGIDRSIDAVSAALRQPALQPALQCGRLQIDCRSFTIAPPANTPPYDAAVLLETIEHVAPQRLSTVERAVFGDYRPRTVIVTTPNLGYNPRYGLAPGQFRHPDHQFEWTAAKFRSWAQGVGRRNRYRVSQTGLGEIDLQYGTPSLMATFTLDDADE
jgi:small RNA 2'-O-methyltransferase